MTRTEARRWPRKKACARCKLAYPASTLAPVLTASAGSFFLDRQQYSGTRSLRVGKASLPAARAGFCVFLTGIGETDFLMRDWTATRAAFEEVVQKCQNPRLKTAAVMRLADTQWLLRRPVRKPVTRRWTTTRTV